MGILAKTCLYNLNLNNKINSSQITKVIEDAEYGWEFLVEASELNVLSKINKKVLKEEDIALTYLKNTFYWDDEYVPEKFELIGIRKIQIKGNVYNCYIFSFSDGGDESYLAISGGFKISDGKLDQDDIFYDYSYEQADSKTKKEEIISNLISTYIEDTLPE